MKTKGPTKGNAQAADSTNAATDELAAVTGGEEANTGSEAISSAVNQPASPASKAPMLKIEVPPTDIERQESIEEIDEDCPSPMSAGPILSMKISAHKNTENDTGVSTFGIRLQRLEESSNMNVLPEVTTPNK